MITRISEIIHEWMGWCPNRDAMTATNRGNITFPLGEDRRQVKNPGPSGADGSDTPWHGRYEHTQRGSFIIGAVSVVIVLILAISYLSGIQWVAIMVLGVMVILLAIMSTLTASVGVDTLAIRFGPIGLIRKSWPLSEIVSATTVTNQWVYGWGIRWTPHGPLYNVAGSKAVEILLYSGKRIRIGTDEPAALKAAIELAQKESVQN